LSDFLKSIQDLIRTGSMRLSEHGYDELAEDGLTVRELIFSIKDAVVVEEYPDYFKGPCILLLQRDHQGEPVHVVWGIPQDCHEPAVLVTAYRPDPNRWDLVFLKRK